MRSLSALKIDEDVGDVQTYGLRRILNLNSHGFMESHTSVFFYEHNCPQVFELALVEYRSVADSVS